MALVVRHAKHTISMQHYIDTCGLSGCTIFSHIYLIIGRILEKKIILNLKHLSL